MAPASRLSWKSYVFVTVTGEEANSRLFVGSLDRFFVDKTSMKVGSPPTAPHAYVRPCDHPVPPIVVF